MAKPPARRSGPLSNMPSIDPALYSNVGRYAGAAVMTVFEQIGGTKAMAEWAEENPTDFYTKLFPKIINSPKQLEVSGKISVEEIVKALDMEEGTDYTMSDNVEDASYEEDD
jgi:hypothetical protein